VTKLKMMWAFLAAGVVGALAWALKLFRESEEQKAKAKTAAELKAKVAEVHAQREAEKAAADAAAAQVQADADKEKARDSVDVANDLIAGALSDAGKPSSKG
jgi:hypothetical protein